MPSPALMAVTAYADFLRFETLPYAGGSFDQPGWLMDEMRLVHSEYSKEKDTVANREQRRSGTRNRGARR